MGGCSKTSTLDVTIRGQQYAYSKLKKVTALAGIQLLSGHLILILVSMLVTVMRCCSTCLAAVTSQPNKQEKRYTAIEVGDLVLVEVMEMS